MGEIAPRVDAQHAAIASVAEGVCSCEASVTDLGRRLGGRVSRLVDGMAKNAKEIPGHFSRVVEEMGKHTEGRLAEEVAKHVADKDLRVEGFVRDEVTKAAQCLLDSTRRGDATAAQKELDGKMDRIVQCLANSNPGGEEKRDWREAHRRSCHDLCHPLYVSSAALPQRGRRASLDDGALGSNNNRAAGTALHRNSSETS